MPTHEVGDLAAGLDLMPVDPSSGLDQLAAATQLLIRELDHA